MNGGSDDPTETRAGLPSRALDWFDARTGIRGIMRTVLDEHIPGGARLAYVFGSGLLFIFLLQMITGISLALYYTPTAETAHTSVAYITKQVAGGAFLRSLHSYGSSAMIIVLGLHFLQTFLYGSFKGKRELLWLSGAFLSLLILGMGFTGYLLPWDQKAYFATAVGTNVAGQVPLIGSFITRFLRGGDTIGTLTLSRFYVAHVFVIPATILLFIGTHVFLFRKAGPAGPVHEDPIAPKLQPETFYPRQVLMDMGFVLVIVAVLGALSYLRPVTLGPIANPSDSQFLPRPEWYYLPMFEWLKFWEGPAVVVGVVVIPGLLAAAFFLMPFLDRRLERRPWRRPIPALAVAIVVLGMVFLGIKSEMDDHQGSVALQLAQQHEQEEAYSKAPFEPYTNAADGAVMSVALNQHADPHVARGKGIFRERGCVGCHGPSGAGTAMAPALVGVTHKFASDQLIALLHNPSAKMRAGGMPPIAASDEDMAALVAYLGALGTPAANVAPASQATPQHEASSADKAGTESQVVQIAAGSTKQPVRTVSSSPTQGKQVYEEHACFVCHGQEGSGGRAPALAPLISNAGDDELQTLLRNPSPKMRKGGMPPVDATPGELKALIAYLRALPAPKSPAQAAAAVAARSQDRVARGHIAPASAIATSAPALQVSERTGHAPSEAGRVLFRSQGCVACHGINAQGSPLAPSLVGVAARFPGEKLSDLLRHPTRKMQDGGMPSITLDDARLIQLVAYLSSLGPSTSAEVHLPASGDSQAKVVKAEPSLQQTTP